MAVISLPKKTAAIITPAGGVEKRVVVRMKAILEGMGLVEVDDKETGGARPFLRIRLSAGQEAFRVCRAEDGSLDLQISEEDPGVFAIIDEVERVMFTLSDEQRLILTRFVRRLMPEDAAVLVVVRLPVRLCGLQLREMFSCVVRRFEAYGRVVFLGSDNNHLNENIPEDRCIKDVSDIPVSSVNAVLFFETVENVYYGSNPYTIKANLPGVVERGCPLYALFMDHSETRFRQVQVGGKNIFVTGYGDFSFFDQRSQPQIGAHHVARLPLLTGKPLNRFAYGRLTIHSTEHGPIDSFGFRNGGDYQELIQRDDRTVVIGLYGGSGAFCWRCHHDDTFGAILERELNHWSSDEQLGLSFRVINFGQLGYTVIEEIQTWILFGNRLKPDVVIAHSGFNDLFLAPLNDADLVERHDLIYNYHYDEVPIKPRTGSIDPGRGERIVHSYVRRVEQFAGLVLGGGARFVFGRQPIWIDKTLSSEEQTAMAQWIGVFTKNQPLYQQTALNMGFLYRQLELAMDGFSEELRGNPRFAVVDCHRPCVERGPEESIFQDVVHITGRGNQVIADTYFAALKEWIIKK